MFDLKPHAPAEVRGEFKPIATTAPGIEISEHLPGMAQWMHRAALVRTVHHHAGCHNTLPSFTGLEQTLDNSEPPKDTYPPGMGAVCELLKPPGIDLPHYVALPAWLGWGYNLKRAGPWGGFLGARCDPLLAEYEPLAEKSPAEGRLPVWMGVPKLAATTLPPEVPADRLDSRRELLGRLNASARPQEGAQATVGRAWDRAFGLLAASGIRRAFDVTQEPDAVRERYGPHVFGSSALIARRLIETGVRFVDLYFDSYSSKAAISPDPYWDTHSQNFTILKQALLPVLDQSFSALLRDLEDRGLMDETLVVISSDFGRTPRVNANAGRDHWTDCYTVVLAGGGVRGGSVYGASDAHAAYIKDKPVRPADICASVYQCLGIPPDTLIQDRLGRPVPIAHGGAPLQEVLT